MTMIILVVIIIVILTHCDTFWTPKLAVERSFSQV